jgi:hypothetical protein
MCRAGVCRMCVCVCVCVCQCFMQQCLLFCSSQTPTHLLWTQRQILISTSILKLTISFLRCLLTLVQVTPLMIYVHCSWCWLLLMHVHCAGPYSFMCCCCCSLSSPARPTEYIPDRCVHVKRARGMKSPSMPGVLKVLMATSCWVVLTQDQKRRSVSVWPAECSAH